MIFLSYIMKYTLILSCPSPRTSCQRRGLASRSFLLSAKVITLAALSSWGAATGFTSSLSIDHASFGPSAFAFANSSATALR